MLKRRHRLHLNRRHPRPQFRAACLTEKRCAWFSHPIPRSRAVRTPWLDKYLRVYPKLQAVAHVKTHCTMWFDCLAQCGLRDGKPEWGQFCIDKSLGHAMEGHLDRGLFFRGAGTLPFGSQVRSVFELMQWLVGAVMPAGVTMEQRA